MTWGSFDHHEPYLNTCSAEAQAEQSPAASPLVKPASVELAASKLEAAVPALKLADAPTLTGAAVP